MSNEQRTGRLAELRAALERGDIDLADFSLSFETALYEAAPYEGRDLPQRFCDLVNRLEIIRFTRLEEQQREEAVMLADEAIRLLST